MDFDHAFPSLQSVIFHQHAFGTSHPLRRRCPGPVPSQAEPDESTRLVPGGSDLFMRPSASAQRPPVAHRSLVFLWPIPSDVQISQEFFSHVSGIIIKINKSIAFFLRLATTLPFFDLDSNTH